MQIRLRSTFALFVSLCSVSLARADELAWGPAAGTTRKKTLEVHHYLDIAKVQRSVGTGPTVDENLSGQLATWERVVFVDRIDEVAAGRVVRWVRNYKDVASGGTADLMLPAPGGKARPMKQSDVCATTMVQRDVRFTWVPAEHTYARLWERIEGPEEFLAHVDWDTDLASVLPGKSVESGDTWSVPAERAVAFLAPGGYRFLEPKQPSQFARTHKVGAGGELAAQLTAPQGTIKATYRGKSTVDGRECGLIELELEIASSSDRAEAFESVVPKEETKDPRRLTSCITDTSFKATGKLWWDLEAKRFHRYELKGSEKSVLRLEKQMVDATDQAAVMLESSTLEGTFELQFANAEPDPVAPAPDAPQDGGAGEKKN